MGVVTSTATATIASGASLSAAVFLGSKTLTGIQMSAGWDAADLTFQISVDGGVTWKELRDAGKTAISISAPDAGGYLDVDASDFKSAMWLKVRSGTASVPVNQTATRTITLFTRKFATEAY